MWTNIAHAIQWDHTDNKSAITHPCFAAKIHTIAKEHQYKKISEIYQDLYKIIL